MTQIAQICNQIATDEMNIAPNEFLNVMNSVMNYLMILLLKC